MATAEKWRVPEQKQAKNLPDTIIAQAANPIWEKLQFYVIISSTINPKLKTPIRIDERNLRLLTTA